MTPDDLRAARGNLGLSTAGLARTLRLGAQGARTVRRWERGDSQIPGPAQVAIEMLLQVRSVRDAASDPSPLHKGVRMACDSIIERLRSQTPGDPR